MNLPSITPEMVQRLMTNTWATANLCYNSGFTKQSVEMMQEYDYLSHYMTTDRVNEILESCK